MQVKQVENAINNLSFIEQIELLTFLNSKVLQQLQTQKIHFDELHNMKVLGLDNYHDYQKISQKIEEAENRVKSGDFISFENIDEIKSYFLER